MIDVKLDGAVWDDVEEGTEALLQDWQVEVGQQVSAGQTLVVAELVKTTHEVTAPAAGRLAAIEVAAGDTFGRHTVLARIEG